MNQGNAIQVFAEVKNVLGDWAGELDVRLDAPIPPVLLQQRVVIEHPENLISPYPWNQRVRIDPE